MDARAHRHSTLLEAAMKGLLERLTCGYPLWLYRLFMGIYVAMACGTAGVLWP